MVKFKIGFTITPEVLFGIISKIMPVDDLHIEQIVETPAPDPKWRPDPSALPPDWKHDWKLDKLKHRAKPRAHGKHAKRAPHPMDLTKGVNKIIMNVLSDGPHKATEMKDAMQETGYSPNSIGSRLQCLEKNGVVVRMGDGRWILAKVEKESV